MRLSHAIPKGKDVNCIWIDWTPEEKRQLRFVAVQEGAMAALSSDGLKGWAQTALTDHQSFPGDAPVDLKGSYQSLFAIRPGTEEWIPARTELNLEKGELLVRYEVNGDGVCQSYLLER